MESETRQAEDVKSWFGGMGSINDLHLCKLNGHSVDPENETIANAELRDSIANLYQAATADAQKEQMMEKFTTLTGIAAPMPLVNIDTDMIIPKQFLKTIKRSGLGVNLFDEMRYDAGRQRDPGFRAEPARLPRTRRSWWRATTSAADHRANMRPGRFWISASAA